ncbi:MAG: VCBS repeat-containing protein [Desulfohalobiaceae bacterium]|nr:VCBS repeat-containing protein [Desulfohalobiaceae bacterium]
MMHQQSAFKLLTILGSWGLLFSVCLFSAPALAADYTVAVLPFKINGPQQYRYLSEGIADMLSTRLYEPEVIALADRQKIKELTQQTGQTMDKQLAMRIGERLRTEYVGFGTVTILGQSLSLDATFLNTANPVEPFTFSRQSDKIDELIQHIDSLAKAFKAHLLGKTQKTASSPETTASETTSEPQSQSGGDGFFQVEQTESPFIQMLEKQKETRKFWQSQRFNMLINAIDVADVDQDGTNELILAGQEKVYIYRSTDKTLQPVQILNTSPGKYNIALDAADINGNGYPEIFVTCLGEQEQRIKSFVLEYNGQSYQRIVQEAHWYYRVSSQPHAKPVLLGQRQRSFKDYSGEIFILRPGENGYQPDVRLLPDKDLNLLGVGYGYVNKTANKNIVAYKPNNEIVIYDGAETEIWESPDKYGGSTLYIAQERIEPGEPRERIYLPVPIRILDIDGNGQNEVVTILNHEALGSHLKRFRYYNKGQLVSLSWDGIGLALDWKTRELSGQVRDFRIADMNNDGRKELVALLIKEEGRIMFREPKCMIISYPLDEER